MFIVYQTTNKINNKIYIGIHDTTRNLCNGFYFGSGKALKQAIKKYGKENFERKTLYEFETLEEAAAKEREIVNEEFVNSNLNYNMTLGGNVPPNTKTWWCDTYSNATSNRMKGNSYRLGKKDSEETRIKKSLSMKQSTTIGRWERTEHHKQQIAERAREQMLNNNPMSNPEFRAKVSLSKIGNKKVVKDGVFKYAKPNKIQSYLDDGFKLVNP